MATRLRKLRIDEISLVDKGSNPHALVTLFKRDTSAEIETPRDAAPLEFGATGRGPAHSALWESFDNYRRQMGPAQGRTAFQTAWADLTDDEKSTIRAEELQTEQARRAAEAAAEAERTKEMMSKMDDKLEQVIKLAHDIDSGRMQHNFADRAHWYRAITKAAETQREQNESAQRSFARYITEDADGKVMFRCYKSASGSDYVPAAPAAPIVQTNSANEEIRKLADEMTGADPSISRLDALMAVHAARPELLAKAKAEA